MAPIELVDLARRKGQRHIGLRRGSALLLRPRPGVTSHRVIASGVAELAQLLVNPDQRQTFARRFARVGRQEPIKLFLPGADLGQRLTLAGIRELRRVRPDHLPHDFPRHPQLAADRLDRFALLKIRPADFGDRLHNQHPDLDLRSSKVIVDHVVSRVPIGRRSPRKRGPYSTPITCIGRASRWISSHPEVRLDAAAARARRWII